MGGEKAFTGKLDSFFKGGNYWHGNEPGHQIPYLFTLAGEPYKTQEIVQSIIAEEYGTDPGGLSGNEDAGQNVGLAGLFHDGFLSCVPRFRSIYYNHTFI